MTRDFFITSKKERVSYILYFMGQNIFYMFILLFLQQFYVIDMAINASIVATIFLVVRIWDAVNDLLFGVIVDKSNFKSGKFKPWVKISTLMIPIFTILIFIMPNTMSLELKIAYATVTYILWDMAYTVCDIPIFALTTAMTNNVKERMSLISFGRFAATIAILVLAVFVPMLYPTFGWEATAVILSVFGFLTMLPISITAKERFVVKKQTAASLTTILKYLVGNKYLLIFYLTLIIASLTDTTITISNFFAIYCLGGDQMISVVMLFTIVPMLLFTAILPKLGVMFDKFHIFVTCTIANIVLSIILYLVGYANLNLFYILLFLRSFAMSASIVMPFMFSADCVEYGTYKTGERAEGVTFSIQTFTTKITGAISGTMGLFFLSLAGFAEGSASQSTATLDAIWFLFSLFPVFGLLAQIVLLLIFYKLRDKDVQIMARANQGEISKEEAEATLTRN